MTNFRRNNEAFDRLYITTGEMYGEVVDGKLYTWGSNSQGQLGDGTLVDKHSPVEVLSGGTTWLNCAAGGNITYATKRDGSMWSFGDNSSVALSSGRSDAYITSPVRASASGWDWKDACISDGGNAFGIKTDGTLWSWGWPDAPYLGRGDLPTTGAFHRIIQIGTATDWDKLPKHADQHMAAIKTDGTLWMWGLNQYGQCGTGDRTNNQVPVREVTGSTWTECAIGMQHTVAVKQDGTLWTWGTNDFGELGDGTTVHKSSPVQTVAGGNTWYKVAAGKSTTISTKTDGTLWAWGNNTVWELGDGTNISKSSPVQVVAAAGADWVTPYAGSPYYTHHVGAIKADGTLWMWGENFNSQLGTDGYGYISSPVQVGAGISWVDIDVADSITIGISADGQMYGWGDPWTNASTALYAFGQKYAAPTVIFPGNDWVSVSCAYGFQALKSDGSLWGWGSNYRRQLGVSTTDNHIYTPTINLSGIDQFFMHPQVGKTHAIARSVVNVGNRLGETDSTIDSLRVVGGNDRGQLGNRTRSTVPSLRFQGDRVEWKDIQLGMYTMHGIKTDGTLWASGDGGFGDIWVMGFTSTGVPKSSPIQVFSGNDWKMVRVSDDGALAIKEDGTLWGWGYNTYGFLGDGTNISKSSPVQTAAGGNTWSMVAAAPPWRAAAIKTDGTLWAWGFRTYGLVPGVIYTHTSSPAQLFVGGTDWKYVAMDQAGGWGVAAIKTDGTLWVWGSGSSYELGLGDNIDRSCPVQLMAGGGMWKKVVWGSDTGTALNADGTLWSWGSATNGAIGDGFNIDRSTPVQVLGGNQWVDVDRGWGNAIALKNDGTIWTWGTDQYGALGPGMNTSLPSYVGHSSPSQVPIGDGWIAVRSFYDNAGGVKSDGSFWSWGRNEWGQFGNEMPLKYNPDMVTNVAVTHFDVIDGSCGDYFSAAINRDGQLFCWGANDIGQLGDGTTVDKSSPVQVVASAAGWKAVACGGRHAVAIDSHGSLWTWGDNTAGQLGNGNTNSTSLPMILGGNWVSVGAGDSHSMAIDTTGQLWLWGNNSFGQLGDGTVVSKSSPVQTLAGGTSWKKVDGGQNHTAALKIDETIWSWGLNTSGQVAQGIGSLSSYSSPVQVKANGYGWSDVSCGDNHTVAVMSRANSLGIRFGLIN